MKKGAASQVGEKPWILSETYPDFSAAWLASPSPYLTSDVQNKLITTNKTPLRFPDC